MDVALRERNFYVVLPQFAFDGIIEFAAETARGHRHLGGPERELEVQRAVTEAGKEKFGFGILQGLGMRIGNFDEQAAQVLDVRAVGNSHGDAKAHARVAVTPVGDAVGDEIGVGHDDGDVVVGDNGGAAQADLAHLAGDAAHFDAVADGDGSLGENNQAADKIADDVLEAEAQTNANRAGKDGQRTQIHAHGLKTDIEAKRKQEVTDDAGKRELEGGVQMGAPQEPDQKVPPDESFGDDDEAEEHNEDEQAGDGNAAAGKQRILEDSLERQGDVLEYGPHSDKENLAQERRRGKWEGLTARTGV